MPDMKLSQADAAIRRSIPRGTTLTRYILRVKVNRTHTHRPGGFGAYWKSVVGLWAMVRTIAKAATRRLAFNLYAKFLLKLPWWLFLKPLGSTATIVTRITGFVEAENGIPIENKLKKTVTLKLLGLPLARWRSKVTEQELQEILK